MVTRRLYTITIALALVCLALTLAFSACEKVPLLAPTGSTITLVAGATALPANGTATIIAQVLESAGTPPHSGTAVTFTTTLGTILPAQAMTDVSGQVRVIFLAGASNGTASINAISGGASTGTAGAVKIAIGTASVGGVRVGANPSSVSAFGGTTTITANIFDINGNALPGVPVSFTTSAGSLTQGLVTADLTGTATTSLTTSQQAVVTATVGATGGTTGGSTGGGTGGTTPTTPTTPTTGQQSGSVTVTVNAAPGLTITPPTSSPSAGLSAPFTFVVTTPTGSGAVKNVTVSWGDGATQNLGVITGSQIVGHVYANAGSYNVTGTLTDTTGNVILSSTSVTVIPVVGSTIIITPSIPASCTGAGICNVSFQVQVTPPTGVGVVNATIDYGDGSVQGLGGLSGSVTVQHPYAATLHGAVTVTVTVSDTLNRSSQGFTTITLP